MDNIFDMDMAFDMSEYWNNSVSSSEIKISDSSETEETEDIYTMITMMPTLQISDDEDEINENSTSVCTVCMEGFKSSSSGGGEGKIIPCGHVYHVDCIAKWLSLYSSCPLCRSTVSGSDVKTYIRKDC
ncbi:RING-type domain-containing protein [Heracleum sosnowskyi]|uniref:RING-type E3 ubiquitin transferase n=1 Tax=Heracleum sosnowskyi TaxID=360622 RepID=A0AAD8GVJ8_9APIA|nr:RING-type domain-containing protein [Heracleum sosnowskyi]